MENGQVSIKIIKGPLFVVTNNQSFMDLVCVECLPGDSSQGFRMIYTFKKASVVYPFTTTQIFMSLTVRCSQ